MARASSLTRHHMTLLHQAAQAIAQADAVVVAAGAGMGVDSGLPDFRGAAGRPGFALWG